MVNGFCRSLQLLLVVAEATWVGCSELVACLGGINKCLDALLSELVLGSIVTCVGFATLGLSLPSVRWVSLGVLGL